MTDAELISAVRRELGRLSPANTVDIIDSDITAENLIILKLIANRIPKKLLRSFTSVAYTDTYAVNTDTIRVEEVYAGNVTLPPSGAYYDPTPHSDTAGVPEFEPDDPYEFPSIAIIDTFRRLRAAQRIRFLYNPITRTVRITPMPTEAGTVYWYLSVEKTNWTLAATPEDFATLLIDGTVWRCMEIVMMRRSTEGGIMREGGRVEYPSDRMKPFIDSKKADFEKALNERCMLYSI